MSEIGVFLRHYWVSLGAKKTVDKWLRENDPYRWEQDELPWNVPCERESSKPYQLALPFDN